MVTMSKVIKLDDETINKLERFRTHIRQTWDDLVRVALNIGERKQKKK